MISMVFFLLVNPVLLLKLRVRQEPGFCSCFFMPGEMSVLCLSPDGSSGTGTPWERRRKVGQW